MDGNAKQVDQNINEHKRMVMEDTGDQQQVVMDGASTLKAKAGPQTIRKPEYVVTTVSNGYIIHIRSRTNYPLTPDEIFCFNELGPAIIFLETELSK